MRCCYRYHKNHLLSFIIKQKLFSHPRILIPSTNPSVWVVVTDKLILCKLFHQTHYIFLAMDLWVLKCSFVLFPGALYDDNTTASQKMDDRVEPGNQHVYRWLMNEHDAPTDTDADCLTWMYHSHHHGETELHAGMLGPLLVCKKGERCIYIREDIEISVRLVFWWDWWCPLQRHQYLILISMTLSIDMFSTFFGNFRLTDFLNTQIVI